MWSHNVHGIGAVLIHDTLHCSEMIWVSWSPGHSLHHPGCNDAARVTQCDVWRVTAWHGNDGPHQSHPSQPRASPSVHHSGRAGWGDASGEVTSPYCTPPGTQLLVSIDTTCTPWNFPMVLSILTPTCSIVAVVSRTVVVSPICPRHQDDGVTPLVDTGQWWHHGPSPGPGLGSWRVSFYY